MYFLRSPDTNRMSSFNILASKIEEKKQELSMSKDFGSSQSNKSNPIISICIESDNEEEHEADRTKTQTPVTGKSIGSYSQLRMPTRLTKASPNHTQADEKSKNLSQKKSADTDLSKSKLSGASIISQLSLLKDSFVSKSGLR